MRQSRRSDLSWCWIPLWVKGGEGPFEMPRLSPPTPQSFQPSFFAHPPTLPCRSTFSVSGTFCTLYPLFFFFFPPSCYVWALALSRVFVCRVILLVLSGPSALRFLFRLSRSSPRCAPFAI
ncbi:hypothetical protein BC826DRAFT_1051625, partial [Russula brevipes]